MDPTTRRPDYRLDALSAFGEYFALSIEPCPHARSLPELVESGNLRDLIARTKDGMARMSGCTADRIPTAAAASSLQLNMVARLLSPAVASALALGAIPTPVDSDSPRWQARGHTVTFKYRELLWQSDVGAAGFAPSISDTLLDGPIAVVNAGFAALSLSPKVMRGNVASAANGAVTVLAMTRPDLETAGRKLVGELLHTPTLEDAGTMSGNRFRRNNCCLFHRVPGGGLCGDCVLTPA